MTEITADNDTIRLGTDIGNRSHQVLELARLLKWRIDTHPYAHLRVEGLATNGDKRVWTAARLASLHDYYDHLMSNVDTLEGVIGCYPSAQLVDNDGQRHWVVRWLALDFDKVALSALRAFGEALLKHEITPYVTRGTRGRGSHIWVFLREPLEQRIAHDYAQKLAALARQYGLELPAIRPSCAYGRGQGLLLPYRAGHDGYGFNPLLDAEHDLSPIPLELLSDLQTTRHEALASLAMALESTTYTCCVVRHPRPQRMIDEQRSHKYKVATNASSQRTWEAELERVGHVYSRDHHNRQNLIMGMAAFGVAGLKLEPELVETSLSHFVARTGDEEPARRLQAIRQTLCKHANGQRIAWRLYYRQAGLEPPSTSSGSPSPEVLARLELLGEVLCSGQWSGTAGKSDRSVYAALILVALEHGTDHALGVAVSIDVRTLAEQAGVATATVTNAVRRLKRAGLIARMHNPARLRDRAGILILRAAPVGVPQLAHSTYMYSPTLGGLKECADLCTHSAFRRGCLNKSSADVVLALLRLRKAASRSEIACVLNRDSRSIRSPLAKLYEYNIVIHPETADDQFELAPDWRERLENATISSGAARRVSQQRERHAAERAEYRKRLERELRTTPGTRARCRRSRPNRKPRSTRPFRRTDRKRTYH